MAYTTVSFLIFLCLISQIKSDCHRRPSGIIVCNSVENIDDFQFEGGIVLFYGNQSSQTINSTIFYQNNKLIALSMSKCLKQLSPGDFHHLTDPSLIVLRLGENVLNELVPGIFNHLLIRELDLPDNQINTLHTGVFSNMSNLRYLALEKNKLVTISAGIFNNLPIEYLNLDENKIYYLSNEAFYDLPKLEKFQISNNQLSAFNTRELFNHQNKMTTLWLNNNLLTEITARMFERFENLLALYMEVNSILTIQPEAFIETPSLNYLKLDFNKLKTIPVNIFPQDGLKNLSSIYLRYNELSFLSPNFLSSLVPALEKLELGGNPWQCGCLTLIRKWMTENKIQQSCDEEFLNGSRPSCIPTQENVTLCDYEVHEENIKSYITAQKLKLFPRPRRCW